MFSIPNPVENAVGIPSDTNLSSQWYTSTDAWSINVRRAWEDYSGQGILITAIDDGFDYTHSDLSTNYRKDLDFDFRSNDADARDSDAGDTHGTSIMGLIAGDDNGSGMVGIAHDASFIGYRVGFGNTPTSAFVNALNHAVQTSDVVNNSWGFVGAFSDNFKDSWTSGLSGALQNLAQNGRSGLGTVTVFAGGNEREGGDSANYHNMTNSPYTIAVGATDSDGTHSYFSSQGSSLLVSAPGTSLYTTDKAGAGGYSSGNYVYFDGTSGAAPIVSGVIGLMLEANRNLGYRDVQEILAYSARHNDAANPNWEYNTARNANGGGLHFSNDYGFGLVDATAAVRLAETWTLQQTYANLQRVSGANTSALQLADTGHWQSSINIGGNIEIEQVSISIDLTHVRSGDLTLTLVSPTGTESSIADRIENGTYMGNINFTFSSLGFWGESSSGNWTLKIDDTIAGNSGSLRNWSIEFLGNAQSVDDFYIYTNDFGDFSGGVLAARNTLSDTDGGTDTINMAAVTAASTINLTTGTGVIAGKAVTINGTFENIHAGDGNDTLTGNTASNTLFGGSGNDSLAGGGGSDTLRGGAGSDTYIFYSGNGSLTIGEDGGIADRILLGTGFATADLVFTTILNDLRISFLNAVNDNITILNHFISDQTAHVENLQLDDGTILSLANPGGGLPPQNRILLLDPVTVNTLADSADINTATYYNAKTISLAFETGSDITTRQVIYEQGGGLRGLNIFIENGKLYQGIWNYNAGTSWGWKEINANIAADTLYTTTLVFSATGGNTGTITGYLNGVQFGQKTGTGYLYGHSEDVGIGWMKDQSRYHGENEYNNGHSFKGEIEKLVQYSTALSGQNLADLHDYMGDHWIDGPVAQDDVFTGATNANITGNLLVDNGNGVDSDPNNDILSVTAGIFTTAQAGSVVISSNGNFTYTPVTNYNGYDSFTYTLLDGNGGDDMGTANLTVGTTPPTSPTQNQAFVLDPVSVNTVADSTAINTGTYYAAKTITVSFETGSDITTRQVLYEQGGGLRGLNIFVENGKLYQGVWNYNAGTSWGWKEIEVSIAADTKYTTTLVFSATGGGTGTITGYLNGVQTYQQTGVGHLYAHSEDVGIGWMKDQSRYHGNNEYNNGHTFTGTIDKVAHYNAALSGTTLADLHDYMAYQWLDEPVAQDDIFTGAANTNITGNLLVDNGNGADSDPDNDFLSVTAGTYTSEEGGSVVILSNGNFTYSPVANYNGYDSFTYTLLDGNGGSDTGAINLTVGTPPPEAPTQDQVFFLNPISVNTVADSTAINTGTYYAAKTISVSFETGADITTKQVIYEQGGGLRGLNIYIENGKLYEGVWNYSAGTSWGWKEVSIDIAENSKYTTTLVLAATGGGTGTLTGYLDGTQIGQHTGTGHLYAHSEDVGIGWMKDQSRYHGNNEYNNGHTFTGEIEKVAHYNAALTGSTLDDLHEYMAYEWLDPQATVILGTSANNTLQGTADNNSIWGLEGADDLYGKDGLDVLLGGDGADKFIFESATAFNDIDIISDFSTSESDKIDISDVLDGFYNPGTEAITDFVQITTNGSNSLLKIDQDGTDNGVNFVQIVQISGVTGLTDEAALISSGNLLVV